MHLVAVQCVVPMGKGVLECEVEIHSPLGAQMLRVKKTWYWWLVGCIRAEGRGSGGVEEGEA
jgi:hypothetical protein